MNDARARPGEAFGTAKARDAPPAGGFAGAPAPPPVRLTAETLTELKAARPKPVVEKRAAMLLQLHRAVARLAA